MVTGVLEYMVLIAVCIAGAFTGDILADEFMKAMAVQHLEGECIAEYIAVGVERSSIVVDNGTCYVSGAIQAFEHRY